jgi:hypothetical protein
MSEDVDVDLREQTFHNAVREVIVSVSIQITTASAVIFLTLRFSFIQIFT